MRSKSSLEWLEQEGEPDTLAEVESWLAENLEKKGHLHRHSSAYMLIAASPGALACRRAI